MGREGECARGTGTRSKPIRALVVDDNAAMAGLMSDCLGMVPGVVVVAIALSGESALELAAAHQVDLGLTDLEMPGINGLQVVPLLRQRFPAIRIIVTSVYEDPHQREAVLRAGANAFIAKRRLAENLATEINRLFDDRS